MIINLLDDNNLRGYTLENTARMIIRRENKNNFIFNMNRFDNVSEILSKYRLIFGQEKQIEFLNSNWRKSDLIEFKLNNVNDRIVEKIIVYDVKSKKHDVKQVMEFCKSNFNFMNKCQENGIEPKVISVTVFENWKISFNVYNYSEVKKRVYTRFKGKFAENKQNVAVSSTSTM
ncbi:hypothetical protein JXM83_02710 [Candidatus Woesearchaeota archaeon]|nr:hypothetical protein [Candidatus Woesearchaeota archaeon]